MKQRDNFKMMDEQLASLNREQQSLRQTMAHLTHRYTPTNEKNVQSEPSFLKPNYLKMSQVELEDKLNHFHPMTASCLQKCDTTEKMDYLRYYLHLFCQITCLEYQDDLWKSYSTMSIIIVTRHMNLTTEFIEQNALNPHLRTICSAVTKKSSLIRAQLNQQRERFYQMKLPLAKTSFEQWLQRLVENDLSSLRTFYAWKKKFFQAQVDDYCLVHSFFEHQPYYEQVRSMILLLLSMISLSLAKISTIDLANDPSSIGIKRTICLDGALFTSTTADNTRIDTDLDIFSSFILVTSLITLQRISFDTSDEES